MDEKKTIIDAVLGIELGSTRIKAVLIGADASELASGGFTWENRYENGIWTYPLDEVWTGMRECIAALIADFARRHTGCEMNVVRMGVSGMMHGYLPFGKDGRQLAAFRTWRNTCTQDAARRLSELFDFNIPQRWSIAHLYQSMLTGEAHVKSIDYITTLAGYVHRELTGERVIGIGEASGMFPLDAHAPEYDRRMLAAFNTLCADMPRRIEDILPRPLMAGENAGRLSARGAQLIDPTGTIKPGTPLCPPEGDAATGMVATNSVAEGYGNISAGTSVFTMAVLERPLSRRYEEIDIVATPTGRPVAMVHCNNCTSEINAWQRVFAGFLRALGKDADDGEIFTAMFSSALAGERDAGGMLLYNYLSGEHITGVAEGRPLFVRTADSRLSFENFMRLQLYSALSAVSIGMRILDAETVRLKRLYGHGGFFTSGGAGQQLAADALNTPVTVMDTAFNGGAWGMALLAAYAQYADADESLEVYLQKHVFAACPCRECSPDKESVEAFQAYLTRYECALPLERMAAELIM